MTFRVLYSYEQNAILQLYLLATWDLVIIIISNVKKLNKIISLERHSLQCSGEFGLRVHLNLLLNPLQPHRVSPGCMCTPVWEPLIECTELPSYTYSWKVRKIAHLMYLIIFVLIYILSCHFCIAWTTR